MKKIIYTAHIVAMFSVFAIAVNINEAISNTEKAQRDIKVKSCPVYFNTLSALEGIRSYYKKNEKRLLLEKNEFKIDRIIL